MSGLRDARLPKVRLSSRAWHYRGSVHCNSAEEPQKDAWKISRKSTFVLNAYFNNITTPQPPQTKNG
ncbi:hypothetical protein BKA56DRAFT_584423 [Ilyonectria sp. MPI-CAGE-AT-0026]|nr:hypothetical protein BKA56DRAFT_584423 [Ilyonectria sp. MPI-CAGE-AT-0026]